MSQGVIIFIQSFLIVVVPFENIKILPNSSLTDKYCGQVGAILETLHGLFHTLYVYFLAMFPQVNGQIYVDLPKCLIFTYR